ncbi:MAG: wax ester/triacylglycerol synthase family O-acyltransferase [Gammaproteobacteria bacterium]|nr:MAG: wax ester/triacylglycerol synthase family O-acyltransferase [Gammaproteobacteria bacterium]
MRRRPKVYKLGALDAGFLYNETDRSPQHIASVQVLELPEGVNEDQYLEQVKTLLMDRIHLVPYFTNKLRAVPFNLDHPVWVKDRAFSIHNHVHRLQVAAPGDKASLEAAIASLHEQRLDRSRPLWDLWILTGLEGGRVAAYNRCHHACLDGMAGQAMIATIMDISAEPREVEPAPAGFFNRKDDQNFAQLLAGAAESFAKYQAKQPLAALKAMETSAKLFRRTFDPTKGFGAVSTPSPATRFNKAVEKKRNYVTGELPLESVRNIAKVTHTKVNDVFLAVVGGGLRRYFERTGELPSASMVAGCPVSLRQPGDTNPNNQVTMMMVSMGTDEADAGDRLQTVAQSARTAKGLTQDVAGSYDAEISMPGLPAALTGGLRMLEMTGAANLPGVRPPCNVVVSNVPGPNMQLYMAGAKVLTHYPVSIPAHGQGVNVTVQSYNGELFFAVTACAKALPDADALRDDLLAEFEALKARYDLPRVSAAAQQRNEVEAASQTPIEPGSVTDGQSKAA